MVKIYLKAPGEKRRSPPGLDAVIHLDEPGLAGYPLHHGLDQLLVGSRQPHQEVPAFLMAALGVWAADKLVARRLTRDAWTRQFELYLPVSSPWVPLAPRLAGLLNFLTGDEWSLKMREATIDLGVKGRWPHAWQPQEVILFSGGLDSLVGAIDRLESGKRLLLVSHYDFGQLAAIQQSLAAALAAQYGPERVHQLALRVQFPEAPELTLRSRSLLYLALGLGAADAFDEPLPLLIPENGWISLNPPLTGNRLGAYSTRTTHPHFLENLIQLWREAGLSQLLVNLYGYRAKGELVAQCRNLALLQQLVSRSISCARPVVGRWRGGSIGSCGYCYPCLVRRAALHRLGWDRGEDYRLDVLEGPETLRHRVRGRDLRALLLALRTWEEDPAEVEDRLWLGDLPETVKARYPLARQVLSEGFREIGRFFRDKGPEWMEAYLT